MAKPKEIRYAGGQTIYNKEMADLKLKKSAQVGDIMLWHNSDIEEREAVSEEVVFSVHGKKVAVKPEPAKLELDISKGVPDGWHALDGKAELLASEYPELAEFMPENVTVDGKIWLPYVRQMIIKISY